MKSVAASFVFATACCLFLGNCASNPITKANAANASASGIERDSREALNTLYRDNPKARELGRSARGILVFPGIVKGGFVFGGMGGNGVFIWPDGSIGGYYQTAGISYGLQIGVQKFGYALFLMDPTALDKFIKREGWEFGGDPSVVVVDKGVATSLSNATLNEGTYAFFFDQKGLMGGLTLQGSKITRIFPKR